MLTNSMRDQRNTKKNASLLRLWALLSFRRKFQLCLLLALVVIASFCELLSVGAIVPFLLVLADPEKLLPNKYLALLVQYLPMSDSSRLPFILTSLFISLVLLSATVRVILNWAQLRVSYGIGIDLGVESYRRTLYQPYQTHVNRNSSRVVLAITQYTRLITTGVIVPVLMSVSASCLLISILAVLLMVNAELTLVVGEA